MDRSTRPGKALAACAVFAIAFLAATTAAFAQATPRTARERLVGAWRLVHIESPGPDGRPASPPPSAMPKGMLVYTRDGHISVQLMYPAAAHTPSNEYVHDSYEASFGTYDVDEAAHTVTHHIEGANTGDRLVGKSLPRLFRFTPDGNLILQSTNPAEHWAVTWRHD